MLETNPHFIRSGGEEVENPTNETETPEYSHFFSILLFIEFRTTQGFRKNKPIPPLPVRFDCVCVSLFQNVCVGAPHAR